jgi:adenylate kinase
MAAQPKVKDLLAQIESIRKLEDAERVLDWSRAQVRALRNERGAQVTALLDRGDTIRFVDQIKPGYLAGLTAEVLNILPDKVIVKTPDSYEYRRYRDTQLKVPKTLVAGKVD